MIEMKQVAGVLALVGLGFCIYYASKFLLWLSHAAAEKSHRDAEVKK